MPKTLSPEHIKKMQEGRAKAARAARKAAIQRVLNYRAWNVADAKAMANGEKMLPMPTCPSDADYDIARAEGAI